MIYKYLFLLLLLIPFSVFGQLKVLSGSTVKVNSGTTLQFISSDSLEIQTGSQFQNNGTILLFPGYKIIENSGFPIYGSGKEIISVAAIPSISYHPGNMGFQFIFEGFSNDTLVIERYHDSLPGFNFSTIKRYYKLFNSDSNFIPISNIQFTGDTSEYFQNLPAKWHLITGDSLYYFNRGSDTSGNIFCFQNDSLNGAYFYSISPYTFSIDSLLATEICQNDSFQISIPLNGAFEDGSVWYSFLSDENGNFPGVGISDTATLLSGTLNFIIAGNTTPSGNYFISVKDSAGIVNEEMGLYTIYNLPDIPNISLFIDTLFCQSNPLGTIQWYFNNVAIPGATDSIHIATANGIYGVEFTTINGCNSYSDFNYIFNNVNSGLITDMTKPYPNPFNNQLNIQLSSSAKIIIWDAIGKSVFESFFNEGNVNIDLSSKNLNPGIYFLQIESKLFKLIKE